MEKHKARWLCILKVRDNSPLRHIYDTKGT
jgi:hypothetical protein